MDVMHRGIITLLKSAITRESYVLPEGFDLEQAYLLVMEHQISTLIYDGAVRCGVDRSTPTMQKLFQVYCKALMISEAQMQEVNRIYAAFEENQIDYMPLKGCLMKAYYPSQELRLMGDADILIRTEQYEKIAEIMNELGFEAIDESDQDYTWRSRSLSVELHKNLMPKDSKDFYGYFGNGWSVAMREKNTRYCMSDENFFLFIFIHFVKHYRSAGIGCRHVLDLWLLIRECKGIDYNWIHNQLETLHLNLFYQNVCRMIAVWFEEEDEEEKSAFMTQTIFQSGSWGTNESMTIANAVRDTSGMASSQGAAQYILRRVFPSREDLEIEWPVIKKAPYLLPLIWLFRLGYKLFYSKTSMRKHRSNLTLLSAKNLEEKRKALHFVDLDYYF